MLCWTDDVELNLPQNNPQHQTYWRVCLHYRLFGHYKHLLSQGPWYTCWYWAHVPCWAGDAELSLLNVASDIADLHVQHIRFQLKCSVFYFSTDHQILKIKVILIDFLIAFYSVGEFIWIWPQFVRYFWIGVCFLGTNQT